MLAFQSLQLSVLFKMAVSDKNGPSQDLMSDNSVEKQVECDFALALG